MNIKIISAGAGSGKTYRLTEEMVALLEGDSGIRATGIIATTFTNKAAAELQERVRIRLLEKGMADKANELTNALIGTVHGLGVKLLKRFAFEAGISPEVDIIAQEDQQSLFNKSLATILTEARVKAIQKNSEALGMTGDQADRWRKYVKALTEIARSNDFSTEVLLRSKENSFQSFVPFLGKASNNTPEHFNENLLKLLQNAVAALKDNPDETKVTQKALNGLQALLNKLQLKGELPWQDWVRISKIKVGAKSRDDVEELIAFAKKHDEHPQFHEDIKTFIYQIFDIAIAALEEYERYKKQRGLIDYVDMETLVKKLLSLPEVKEVLRSEIDLLMVDEFQDTSPLQLDIFLKLSRIVKHSIWVGDPKQSIYGFRGADPKLMQEIIRINGIQAENILKYSWRSREDIVNLTNSLFVKAFSDMPKERVALKAKRTKEDNPEDPSFKAEAIEMLEAIHHWHFEHGEERMPGKPWMENCLAEAIRLLLLERAVPVLPKGSKNPRAIRPSDIAVLCRSNTSCQNVAEALHRSGLKAAIARAGLLETAEAKLILACLKFLLHPSDSLSIAEILLLADGYATEGIIADRLAYLKRQNEADAYEEKWAKENFYIQRLHELREEARDLSGAEILDLTLEELDLRRIIATWGGKTQRMANVDQLRFFALQYEEACNRMHIAASLGGFLLWLNDLQANGLDEQGSGESPDAVNVMTYHKSKGLEWPAVICYDLENSLREKTFGFKIIPESEEVDLDNLLGNRWVRFWINPYGRQNRNTLLEARMMESAAFAEARKEALAEDTRLLYVGITRARDYLIFPSRGKTTAWLNRVWHLGKEDHPCLDKDDAETPWDWEGKVITKATEVMFFDRDFPYAESQPERIPYLQERAGKKEHMPYYRDWRKVLSPIVPTCREKFTFAAIPKVDLEQQDALEQALYAMIMGDAPNLGQDRRIAMATKLLERFGLERECKAKDLAAFSNAFYHLVVQKWSPTIVVKHYPIFHQRDGQRLEMSVDLLLETKQGQVLLLLDTGAAKQHQKKGAKSTALLHLASDSLRDLSGKAPLACALLFYPSAELWVL